MPVIAMPQECSWRELPLIDGLDEAAESYPETRIGAFGFSAVTSTEVIGYASGSAHRASIDSCREVATDLGFYSQPDPVLMAWDPHPMPYSYGLANPVILRDPLGLYALAPSCLFKGLQDAPTGFNMEPGDISGAISAVCAKTQNPTSPCAMALSNVSAMEGLKLPSCFSENCVPGAGVSIQCEPRCGNCGEWNRGGAGVPSNIVIGLGNRPVCPKGAGLGYAPTLFHETLHECKLETEHEPSSYPAASRRAALFRYLEWTCWRWKRPQ